MRHMFENMKELTIVEPIVTLRGRLTENAEKELEALASNLLSE